MKNIMKIMCGIIISTFVGMTCVACTNCEKIDSEETSIIESSETNTETEEITETEETTETTEIETEETSSNDETDTTESFTDVSETMNEISTNTNTNNDVYGPTKNQSFQEIETKENVIYNKNSEDRAMGSENIEEKNGEDNADVIEDNSSLSVSDADYILLCNAVAHEAGSDWISTEEKAKVAEVILNRVNSGSYPDTVYGVLTQKGQFSGASGYVDLGGYSSKVSEDVKAAVDMALDSSYNNNGYTGFWGDGRQNHFH